MYAHVVVGQVAAPTPHLANLCPSPGFDLDAGADRIAITGGADQAKADPRFAVAAVIPVEARPGIEIDDKDIDIPVTVVIPECRAARGPRRGEISGHAAGDLGEASIAKVAVEFLRLQVSADLF